MSLADGLCVACTLNVADKPIVALTERLNVKLYQGSEKDVLARHFEAALKYKAEHIIRVTSDCPLIDPFELDLLISAYLSHSPKLDYMSSGLIRSYPRGMEAEIFSFDVLRLAHQEAKEDFEREHVTPFIYRHPERFRLAGFSFNQNQSNHRWTVDTHEDFELVKKIITELFPAKPEFSIYDVLALLSERQDLIEINRHVRQKGCTE